MLKDIIKKIDSAIPSLFPVDAAKFNDPVALQTGWKGVRSGRSGGASAKLVQKDENLLAYKPSIMGYIMGVIFVLAGVLIAAMYFSVEGGGPWFMLLVGPVFALVGVIIFIQASSPTAFDKSAGLFYKGRKQQNNPDVINDKHGVRFSDIHAIQLLTRLESSKNDNNGRVRYYQVYDLNLVKHDSERIYVMTYGKALKAREDAGTIAGFIKVPVWDGIDG